MGRDTPTEPKDVKDRGLHARHAGDPTLASYLSSFLFALSVPGFVLLSYAGYWQGWYPYSWILGIFGGLMAATIALVFVLMHVLTGR